MVLIKMREQLCIKQYMLYGKYEYIHSVECMTEEYGDKINMA